MLFQASVAAAKGLGQVLRCRPPLTAWRFDGVENPYSLNSKFKDKPESRNISVRMLLKASMQNPSAVNPCAVFQIICRRSALLRV